MKEDKIEEEEEEDEDEEEEEHGKPFRTTSIITVLKKKFIAV